jgi:hypothetical protein
MEFRRENDLEKAAIPFLEKSACVYSWQVPLQNRLIDLAAINRDGHVIAIEFKLKKWRRALQQARANSNAFDYVYVCVPGGNYVERLIENAKEHGIGVMIYDKENASIKIELDATKNDRIWQPNFDYVRTYIKRRGIVGGTRDQ